MREIAISSSSRQRRQFGKISIWLIATKAIVLKILVTNQVLVVTEGGDETKKRHALEIVDYSIGHMKHTKEQKQNQKLMISYFDKSTQLLGLLCLWQCLNPAQAKRSGGGMGGVDQAQVILSQLNATNKVNSKLCLYPLLCVILSFVDPDQAT